MRDRITMKLAEGVANERGISIEELVEETFRKIKETHKRLKSENGKFRVIGVDKFSGENFPYGEYNTAEDALKVAREKTIEARRYASDSSVATVYYAYTPNGEYLGGDTWENE